MEVSDILVKSKLIETEITPKRCITMDGNILTPNEFVKEYLNENLVEEQEIKKKQIEEKYEKQVLFSIIDYRPNEIKKTKPKLFLSAVYKLKQDVVFNKEIVVQFIYQNLNFAFSTEFQMTLYLNQNGQSKWLPKQQSLFIYYINNFKIEMVIVNSFVECYCLFNKDCSYHVINSTNMYINFKVNNSSNQIKCLWTVCFHFLLILIWYSFCSLKMPKI